MPFLFLIGQRRRRAEFEVTTENVLKPMNQGDSNASQIPAHHTPNNEKQSHELQPFSNEGCAS